MDIIEVFPWNKNFETGMIPIDNQHKRLVQLLNLLASHLAYKSDIPTLNHIFTELTEYAIYHFQTEENLWREFLAEDHWEIEHKKAHQNFIIEITTMKAEEADKPFDNVIEDILMFLTHWLAFHILESDKRMIKTILGIQSGLSISRAKRQAEERMTGTMAVLIETILTMYDSLSSRTLQLMREITERQKTEVKLRLAANVFDNTLDAICITNADFIVIDANPSFYQVYEYSDTEVLGQNVRSLKSGLLEENLTNSFWDTLNQRGHWSGVINNRRKTGDIESEWLTLSLIKNELGLISHYVLVFSNVSHLIQQQKTLERIAHHDALTGLPNRLLLKDRLELAIAYAERTHTFLAICYLDLDGFKAVNDELGHAAGDQLLCEIALRLLAVVRAEDTVARLGGDEFVILFGNLKTNQTYVPLLERILMEISLPLQIQNQMIEITASVGVSVFPLDKSEPEMLLHHADLSMYKAKSLGKSRYYVNLMDSL